MNQTAAERYREILQKRRDAETYKKTNPATGMEWTLCRVNAQRYVLAGKLPLSIVEKVARSLENASPEQAFTDLSPEDQTEAMKFMQFLVREVAVSPKIVKEATGPDEVDEILEEDFAFLLREAMGGDRAEALSNFPEGQNAVAGDNRKKRGTAAK
jgi:hypothetical protein